MARRRQAAVRGRASCGNGPRARANSLAGSHSRRGRVDRVPSIRPDTVRAQTDDRRRQVPDTGQGRILRPLGRSSTTDPWMAETASLRTAKRPWAAPRLSRQGQASSTSLVSLPSLEVKRSGLWDRARFLIPGSGAFSAPPANIYDIGALGQRLRCRIATKIAQG